MIFPATDTEIQSLDNKELYYGYYMDMPDENLMIILQDRPMDILCEEPKIYKVGVSVCTDESNIKLKLENHLDDFCHYDENVYTDYPLYKLKDKWYSSYDSLVIGYSEMSVREQLSKRLFHHIEYAILITDARRFKWYLYCLNIIMPNSVKGYEEKYPELLI